MPCGKLSRVVPNERGCWDACLRATSIIATIFYFSPTGPPIVCPSKRQLECSAAPALDKCLLPIMSIAGRQGGHNYTLPLQIAVRACFFLLRAVRECSHLLKRNPDEAEAPRSEKIAEMVD